MITELVLAAALASALVNPHVGEASTRPTPHAPLVLAGGCHADQQRHHVPELRSTMPHRHLPGDCRPVPTRRDIKALDCHRDVRRHFVPGLGVVLHRHVGTDCAIRRVNRSTEPKP